MLIAYKLYDTNECVYVHVLFVCLNCMCVTNVFVRVCVCPLSLSIKQNHALRSDDKINIISLFGVMIRSI